MATATRVKERPVIFSGPMVKAILAGTKTMTRRVIKPQPKDEHWALNLYREGKWDERPMPFPVGTRLWVREKWLPLNQGHFWGSGPKDRLVTLGEVPRRNGVAYATDMPTRPGDFEDSDRCRRELGYRWRSPIHMPRWASRITLEVTGIKVERVQAISEADAIAEGLRAQAGDGTGPGPGFKWHGLGYHGAGFTERGERTYHVPGRNGACACRVGGPTPAQCAFRETWDAINGKRPGCAWKDNPFVFAITFRRVSP